MPPYRIRGIDVEFPYDAYDCQLLYMEKVIQSLQQGSNALLESPTGTGKTLCLLCATLAWRKSLGEFSTGQNSRIPFKKSDFSSGASQSQSSGLPMIIYTSRTHSQLRQVVQELKRSSYRPKMVVLGSREQYCIHEDVSLLRGRSQNNACQSLCKKRKKRYCSHFPRVTEFMCENRTLGDEPIDIEDMVNIGKSCGPCPYYMSRELHKVADIIFAPYNYLIDPAMRESLSIQWGNSVLIFDEAHNLESLCADAASFDLSSGVLTACISEAQNCIDISVRRRNESSDYDPDNFAILRALLLKLEKKIAEIPIESIEMGFTKPGHYIYELLDELNVKYESAKLLIDVIEQAALLLEEDSNVADGQGRYKFKSTVCRLETIKDILKIIFKDGGKDHAKYYRFHVQEVAARTLAAYGGGTATRTLSWWCFNPGIAMEELRKTGVGSIILTSGTLSPMDSFALEFKLEFPIRLENPHVISANQIWTGVVPVGPSGFPFNSSYRSRDSKEYKLDLGNAIVNFARIVPDGLLVFFPSYYLLETLIGFWKDMANSTNSTTIWERICKHKQPVVEPRQSSLFAASIEDYMAKLKDTSTTGAIFFAVCRGKVSEGLDFADCAGRAVVVTGIPYATWHDPKVRLKREFLDQNTQSNQKGSKALSGEEWYGQQAIRAVNQAVGRVIRHRHDYGAIIFCDERFTHASRQAQISLWIQPYIKCYSKFGEIVFTLTRFFRDGTNRGPMKLEMSSKEDNDEDHASTTVQTAGKSHLENLLSGLTTPTDLTRLVKAESPISKLEDYSSLWDAIVPANRSSLSSDKQLQSLGLKRSSEFFCKKSKPLINGKKIIPHSDHIIDLTSDSSTYEGSEASSITPCTLKKPKLETCLLQNFGSSGSMSEVCRQKNSALASSSTSCSYQEKKGSAFLNQTTPTVLSGSGRTPSPIPKLKDFSTIWEENVPANRLSPSSEQTQTSSSKCCSDSFYNKPKLLIPGKKTVPYNDNVIDLTCDSSTYEVSKAPSFTPCTMKKPKMELGLSQNVGSQKNNGAISSSTSSSDQEKKGLLFLNQVKEKLADAEYKEFVGYMKALKSKAMKIGQVLQSIIGLFSSPDRISLRERFKDYIPAKFRPLYEEYLRRSRDAAI